MSTHTPAEQACFDALVAHNTPMDPDHDIYPSCLWPIAEAATAAVLDALADAREDSGDRCRVCYYPIGAGDGARSCENCGWSA